MGKHTKSENFNGAIRIRRHESPSVEKKAKTKVDPK